MTETQGPAHKKDMTRRRMVFAGGAAIVAAGIGAGVGAGASADEVTSSGRGKKYAAGQGEESYRMTLRVKVIDSDTCKPVSRAAVDIWHCDALGIYSGYESMSSGGPGGGGTPPSGAPTDAPTGTPTGAPTGTPPSGGPGGGGGG